MDQRTVTACSTVDSSNAPITNMKTHVFRDMCVFWYLLFQTDILPSSSGSSSVRRAAAWQDMVTYEGCPGSIQPEETLLYICEQSLSRGASQSAVRRR